MCVPSSNTSPGVPLMRCLRPSATLRCSAEVSHCALLRGDRRAVEHPVAPGLGVVLRAPDVARLVGRIAAEDRVQEGVDRDVLDLPAGPSRTSCSSRSSGRRRPTSLRAPLPCFQTIASFSGKRREVDRGQLGDARLRSGWCATWSRSPGLRSGGCPARRCRARRCRCAARRRRGSAVLLISSIFGKSGRRSARFLRITASCARAPLGEQRGGDDSARTERRCFGMKAFRSRAPAR